MWYALISFKYIFKLQKKTFYVYTASETFIAIKLPLIVIKGKRQQCMDEYKNKIWTLFTYNDFFKSVRFIKYVNSFLFS